MTHPLPEGVYESLRTDRLEAAVEALTGLTPRWHGVEPADAPHVLARHVAESVERRLTELRDPDERLALVNELLGRVAEPGERVRPSSSSPCSAGRSRRGCTGSSGR